MCLWDSLQRSTYSVLNYKPKNVRIKYSITLEVWRFDFQAPESVWVGLGYLMLFLDYLILLYKTLISTCAYKSENKIYLNINLRLLVMSWKLPGILFVVCVFFFFKLTDHHLLLTWLCLKNATNRPFSGREGMEGSRKRAQMHAVWMAGLYACNWSKRVRQMDHWQLHDCLSWELVPKWEPVNCLRKHDGNTALTFNPR